MLSLGAVIEGKYEILAIIRESEAGAIYKVRHVHLDEIRVIKAMRLHGEASDELARRFLQEAKTLTRLKHPNFCAILDLFQDPQGIAYIVLEYVDGVTMAELLSTSGRPSLTLALEIGHQTLLALDCLHRRNIVHRDIAPDNIMLTMDENREPHVKVIGLGVAKMLTSTAEITASGGFVGKMKYSSPEQLGALEEGDRLDGRSDLYSLGVVLYEMLTGILPVRGDHPRQILVGHLSLPPIPFMKSDPEGRVPQEVGALILKALEKKRENRFPSAEEFDRELLSLAGRFARGADAETTRPMTIGEAWKAASVSVARPGISAAFKRERMRKAPVVAAAPTKPAADAAKASPADPAPSAGLSTPSPPPSSIPTAAPVDATLVVAPAPPPKKEAVRLPVPDRSAGPRFWKQRGRQKALLAAVAAGVLLGVLFLSLLRSKTVRDSPAPASPQRTPADAAAPVGSEIQGKPKAPLEAGQAVLVAAAVPETPSVEPPSVDPGEGRWRIEASRDRMMSARLAAEAEEAPSRSPNTYRRARQKQTEAELMLERQEYDLADQALIAASQLFQRARDSSFQSKREKKVERTASSASLTSGGPPEIQGPPTPVPEPVRTMAPLILVPPVVAREIGPSYPGSDTLPPGPDEIVIVVEAVVTEQGEVQDAQVANVQYVALDRAAIYAVSNWRFRPGMINGNPVATRIQVTSVIRRTKNLLGNRLKEVSRKTETLGVAAVPGEIR